MLLLRIYLVILIARTLPHVEHSESLILNLSAHDSQAQYFQYHNRRKLEEMLLFTENFKSI